MTKEPVMILVDVHELDSEIIDEIRDRGLEPVQESLKSGDVVLSYKGKTVGIELKRGQDFSNSTKEGRLKDQICRLYDNYDWQVLIIESWKPWFGDEDTEDTVKEKVRKYHMAVRTLNRRLTVYETDSQVETVNIIEEIARDLLNNKLFVMKRPILIESEMSDAMKMLCSLPQVSRERAEILLDKYGSVRNALFHLKEWHELKISLTESRCERIRIAWEEKP